MFETKMGRWCLGWFLFMAALLMIHWWQDALGEDRAVVWSCLTMGNHMCSPTQPWITFRWGHQ